jgi:hypothetical protein
MFLSFVNSHITGAKGLRMRVIWYNYGVSAGNCRLSEVQPLAAVAQE